MCCGFALLIVASAVGCDTRERGGIVRCKTGRVSGDVADRGAHAAVGH